MLRVAGRGKDGLAKSLKVSNDGVLHTSNTEKIKLLEQMTPLASGEVYTTKKINVSNINTVSGVVNVNLTHDRNIKIILVSVSETEPSYFIEEQEEIYKSSSPFKNHSVEFLVKTEQFYFKFENLSSVGTSVHTTTSIILDNNTNLLSDKKNTETLKGMSNIIHSFTQKEEILNVNTPLVRQQSIETNKIYSNSKINGTLMLNLTHLRTISITLITRFESEPGYFIEEEEEIFVGKKEQALYNIPYSVKGESHYFRIKNESLFDTVVFKTSCVVLTNTKNSPDNTQVLLNEIDRIVDSIPKQTNNSKPTKMPTTTLKFRKANIEEVQCFTNAEDGFFYTIPSDAAMKKYSDITGEAPTVEEEGIVWNNTLHGRPVKIIRVKDGFVVFSNSVADGQACVYRMATLNDTPELVYKSQQTLLSQWTLRSQFGIKYHDNGFETLILAGVYGSGAEKRDLLLSTDSGKTFKVINQTANNDTSGPNSHWHDVEIDIYHGLLWASEGDSALNRNVWWSDDMGENWNVVTPNETIQPTTLTAFPDKVLMGRDSHNAGFDVLKKPESISTYQDMSSFTSFKEFKPSTKAIRYYAHSPVARGCEAYTYFSIDGQEPRLVVGTGDFGESLHFVFMGYGNDVAGGTISGLAGIDENYVFAYGDTSNGKTPLLYADKVKWM